MACILVIYGGDDAEELKKFDRICSEADPERRTGSFRRLSPNGYWMSSLNLSEVKVAKLGREITQGKWYVARLEDDDFVVVNGERWAW